MLQRLPFRFFWLVLFVGCASLMACDNWLVYFNSPFPKKSIPLARVFGPSLTITNGSDTSTVLFEFEKASRTNHIIDLASGDTIWSGLAARHRKMVYLSQEVRPGKWHIGPMKIHRDTIYGFADTWLAMHLVKREVDRGGLPKLLIAKNDLVSETELTPDKHTLHRFCRTMADSLQRVWIVIPVDNPDPIALEKTATLELDEPEEPELSPTITLAPNPATDFVRVMVDRQTPYYCEVRNISGQLLSASFHPNANEPIDVSQLHAGIYLLTVRSEDEQWRQSRRLVVL